MNYPGYFYDRRYITQYSFVSKGAKGAVTKLVQFSPTNTKNVLNLSFGDMLPNGGIDDKANTNNNDIIKVIATVIEITNDFTMEYPNINCVCR